MIQGLKPYPEYKDIDQPWLGAVPTHWQTERGKRLFLRMQRPARIEDDTVTCFRDGVVTLRKNRRLRGFTEALKEIGYQGVRAGDLVIHAMDAFAGAVGVSDSDGKCSPVYQVCQPRGEANAMYYAFLVREMSRSQWIMALAKGIRERSTDFRFETFGGQFLPVPPHSEQAGIVRFLAAVDRKVNRFIRTKRRLIEVLTEQKQAIITQAVTRGLNPDAPMKPSGIDWLGDVPGHWDVVRFKNRVSFQEGPGIMAADFRDSGVPLLRISCVNTPWSTLSGCNYLDPNKVAIKWSHFAVRAGDYLLTSSGSTGVVSRATSEVVGAIPYTGIIRLWPAAAHRTEVNMEFIRYFIGSLVFQSQISAAKSGVGIEHFGPTHLKRMWLSLPPVSEQRELVRHIESGCSAIDATLESAGREIALIREYRTRLVADVVTGKIDVRSVALPDDDENTLLSSFDSTLDDESLAEGDSEESDAEFSTLAAEDEA
jgi:type I restriction enzyme S subunit